MLAEKPVFDHQGQLFPKLESSIQLPFTAPHRRFSLIPQTLKPKVSSALRAPHLMPHLKIESSF
jgi:hypothetical protein